MSERQRLLVIQPHPDDMAFFMGGAIATYADRGIDTYVLTLTDGEKGSIALFDQEKGVVGARRPEPTELEWLIEQRQAEDEHASRILGVTAMRRSHIPDKEVAENAIPIIRESILTVNPEIVLTFGELGTTNHPDHAWAGIATYYAALTLLRTRSRNEYLKLARYLTLTLPTASRKFALYGEIDDPSIIPSSIDIRPMIPRKIEASRQYGTQAHLFRFFEETETLAQPQEHYIERIGCEGLPPVTDDLFSDTDISRGDGYRVSVSMPLDERSYVTNDANAMTLLKERVQRAEAVSNVLFPSFPSTHTGHFGRFPIFNR